MPEQLQEKPRMQIAHCSGQARLGDQRWRTGLRNANTAFVIQR